MQSLPALWASSQHHEWHLQDLFQRAGTSFCHTFGTCVPWQGPGGEWAQNDREELGRAGLMKGKIILNLKKKKKSTNSCTSSSFCFPAQVWTNTAVFCGLWAALTLSASQREHFRAGKGDPRAATSQKLCVARETALLVMEASFWGYFLLLFGFVSPQPQVTESAPEHKPGDRKQNAAEPTQSQQEGEGAQGTRQGWARVCL